MNNQEMLVTYEDTLELTVRPDAQHEWLLETPLVAKGYGVSEGALRVAKSRNEQELLENKHFITVTNCNSNPRAGIPHQQIFWTKRGVVRLGFFIKSERAKKFRDWAEDLIVKVAEQPLTPISLKDALLLAYQKECELEEQKSKIATLEVQVGVLSTQAEYTEKVLSSKTDWTITTIAKELGMTAIHLNELLHSLGIQFKNGDGVWVLYAPYQNKGYTETRTYHYNAYGSTNTAISTVWTEAGRMFIHGLLNPKMNAAVTK